MRRRVETKADRTTWEGLDSGVSTENCVFSVVRMRCGAPSVWAFRSVVVSQHLGISHFRGAKPRLLVRRTCRRAQRLQRICITSLISLCRDLNFFFFWRSDSPQTCMALCKKFAVWVKGSGGRLCERWHF